MKDKKMDWLKPLLIELEKATYTVGGDSCVSGKTPGITPNAAPCTTGGTASGNCYNGGTVT